MKHLSVWSCFWWNVLWRVPQADPPSQQNQTEGIMLRSDIFYVGSGIDRVKYGTRKRIWQKTVWLYALWMKTQLIFLARRGVFSSGSSRLVTWLVKGTKQKLVDVFSFLFDTFNLVNKVVKQKPKGETDIKCSFIYHAQLKHMQAAS